MKRSSNRRGFVPRSIAGTPPKSVSQFYNKRKAQLQTPSGKRQTSHRSDRPKQSSHQYVDRYLHQTSRLVVNYVNQQEVGALVIGKNERWKQSISTGQPNNHNSV
ncbi:hypothetical protein [Microcoleus sp. herbarium12]|uniref:hypothetical protein n=1 Tax=Microcoleus sp. herbarium12 TaxID=3055437 RepID=UPI002FD5B16A